MALTNPPDVTPSITLQQGVRRHGTSLVLLAPVVTAKQEKSSTSQRTFRLASNADSELNSNFND